MGYNKGSFLPNHIYSMDNSNKTSRRKFLGQSAALLGAVALPACATKSVMNTAAKVSSTEGFKLGAISYSFRELSSDAMKVLEYSVNAGMNTIELMGWTAEGFAGAPAVPTFPGANATKAERDQFRRDRSAQGKAVKEWRATAKLEKFEELREIYNNAGVEIDILKLGEARWSDSEIDYAFEAARLVGARGISFEISNEVAERMAPFAAKHKMLIGMHNHLQVAKEDFSWDIPLSHNKYCMLNVDIGHYTAALGPEGVVPLLKKYNERITHLHIKDRLGPENGQDNVEFGKGDTPIIESLQLLQSENYPISAMIELEYPTPDGSTVEAEMGRCVQYCKDALKR